MIKIKATVLSEISNFTLNSPSNVCLVATFYKMFDKTILTQGFLTVCVHIGLFCSSSFTSKANVQCQSSKKLVNRLFCQTDEPKESISRFPKFVIFIWFWVNWPFKKMSCCPVLLLLFFLISCLLPAKKYWTLCERSFTSRGRRGAFMFLDPFLLHTDWTSSSSSSSSSLSSGNAALKSHLHSFFFRMYRVWLTQSEFILESLTGFMSVC